MKSQEVHKNVQSILYTKDRESTVNNEHQVPVLVYVSNQFFMLSLVIMVT